jgi:hypothetical protein
MDQERLTPPVLPHACPRRGILLGAAGLLAVPAVPRAQPRPATLPPLTVGSGQRFATLSAAIAVAHDGDVVQLQPGTYTDDFAVVGVRLTIRAAGGMARLRATSPPPNGKAILVATTDLTVEGVEFTGTATPSQNGAGIRYEGGHLVLRRCHFHGNQMNLLAAPNPAGGITIERCEFGATVAHAGLAHNLYVNQVGRLTVRDSLFHGAATGHQIKSRALVTSITGTRILEGHGAGAYNVDLPNGGRSVLEGCVLEQGAATRNPAMVNFGGEGVPHPASALRIAGCIVLNRLPTAAARLLRNHTETAAELAGNRVFGLSVEQLAEGPAKAAGTTFLREQPALGLAPPWAAPVPPPSGRPGAGR